MTDNPLRRAMQESADMGARLLRAKNQDIANRLAATPGPGMSHHLDRAITDAVQENNMGMADYYAIKDAETEGGSTGWSQVPVRFGGTLNTGHPEDQED